MPFSPLHLLALLLLLGLLLAAIQVGLLAIAFEKLGLSAQAGIWLLFSALSGSLVNVPVMRIRARMTDMSPVPWRGLLRATPQPFAGETLIAVNLGGCIIPVLFSLYLFYRTPLDILPALAAIACVSAVCYGFSRPIPGIGVGMPLLIAPVSSALVALLIDVEHSAPLAYVGGTLGVLIGADLLRLRDVPRLGAPMASIGGAGTFDGIFMTGIVAALLA